MSESLDRKNQLDIVEVRGDLKLLSERLDVIKNNDLVHIQKGVDGINKILWAVGLLLLGQIAFAIKTALWS
jgi:transketolase C-terminal domain/subunit|tara:strand:- start:100 stop:312 length:213 start_codon:yes stop_codon:yes gene_type:complete